MAQGQSPWLAQRGLYARWAQALSFCSNLIQQEALGLAQSIPIAQARRQSSRFPPESLLLRVSSGSASVRPGPVVAKKWPKQISC
jgi:hypothetical protein